METIELTEEQLNNMRIISSNSYESIILEYKNDYVIKYFRSHIWKEKRAKKKAKLIRISQKVIKDNVITKPLSLINVDKKFSAYLMKKEIGTNLKKIENIAFIYKIYIETFKKLKYLHSKGICICDLKPENIIAPNGIFCDIDSAKVDEFDECYSFTVPTYARKDNNIFYKLQVNSKENIDYLLLVYSFINSLDKYESKYMCYNSILNKLNLSLSAKKIIREFINKDTIEEIPDFPKILTLEGELYGR